MGFVRSNNSNNCSRYNAIENADKFIEYRGERSADDLLSFVMFSNERSDGVELFTPKDPVEIAKIRHEVRSSHHHRLKLHQTYTPTRHIYH